MGQEAAVADADEAARQQVQQEAAQKLVHRESHQLLLVAVGRITPAESDLSVLVRHQTMIRDRDAVGVTAQ